MLADPSRIVASGSELMSIDRDRVATLWQSDREVLYSTRHTWSALVASGNILSIGTNQMRASALQLGHRRNKPRLEPINLWCGKARPRRHLSTRLAHQ